MADLNCSDNFHGTIDHFLFQDSFFEEQDEVIRINDEIRSPIKIMQEDFANLKNFVKFGHVNAVTVPGNRDELIRLFNEIDFDIFAVSETNIHKNTPKSAFSIPDYRFFHQDREGDNHAKGGCGIYVKKELKAKHIPIAYEHDKFEVCAVEITVNKVKVIVIAVYKSPSTDPKVFTQIFDALQFLVTKYKHVVMLGDMNIDYFKKHEFRFRFFNSEIVEPLGLTQIIEKPTRITKNTKSLIDIILVSSTNNVKFWNVTTCPFHADHDIIYMSYNFKREKFTPKVITKRCMKDFSDEVFHEKLGTAPWGNIYTVPEDEIDDQVTILENVFRDVVDQVAPFKTFRVTRPPTPWMTEEMKTKMHERDKLRAQYKSNFDNETFEKYKELRNTINHEKRRAKIKHFNSNINKQTRNSKRIHHALKIEGVVDSKKENGDLPIIGDLNLLNMVFSRNNNKEIDLEKIENNIRGILQNCLPSIFKFEPVSELEVIKVIKSIKTNAMGVDQISAKFIKSGAHVVAPFITDIMNNCIRYCKFPCRWKFALIKPLPKVPNPISHSDFRPISLLPAFSKIIEKILGSQMQRYLNGAKLINKFQSAYTVNYSCTTVLLVITDFIFNSLDKGELVILVLLDYSKAFDCANHDLILAKARALGFMDSALLLLNSYLSDRFQKIKLENEESEWTSLINGVPQGSILGPLLFTILLTDIKDVIVYSKHHCYADDTQVYTSCKLSDVETSLHQINCDLENIAKFSENNSLDLNAGKSKYIIFGSKSNLAKLDRKALPPVLINKRQIDREKTVKNLGIIFDENLSFEKQISKTVSKSVGKLKHAFRFKNFLSQEAKIIIVESYILSNLNYCDILFQNLSCSSERKLQKLQNWCVRFIFGARKYDHVSPYYKKLKTLNIEQRRLLHSLTQMHKLRKNIGPDYLLEKLVTRNEVHQYNTRRNSDLLISKSRTSLHQKKFFNKIPKIYNDILKLKNLSNKPIFRVEDSVLTFKKKFKKQLLNSSQF